jgi:hypothetical protein
MMPAPSPPSGRRPVPLPAKASGQPVRLLADDYFRVSHDDHSGGLRLQAGIAGIGLASALLGELVWESKVVVEDGRLVWCDRSAPRTALTHRVLEQIIHEPVLLTVREWLIYLSIEAHEQVAQRLLDTNQVAQVRRRRGLRHHLTYEPADPNEWVWTRLSIADALNHRRRMSPVSVHLAGLVKATNLLGDVMTHYDGADYLDQLLPQLPAGVVELLAITSAVVNDRVLSGH